jgi:putative flippase GtrA
MVITSQLLRYGISGIVLNVLGFIFYVILLKLFNYSPMISLSISYPAIIAIYYISQSLFVFRKKLNIRDSIKFFLNILFLYLVNILLLFIWTEKFNFSPTIVQFFIIFFLILLNYFVQNKFIFKSS